MSNGTGGSFAGIAAALFVLPVAAFGQQVSFGVVAGTSLTPDYHTVDEQYQDSDFPNGLSTFVRYSGPRSLIVGPMMEVGLPERLSIEVNALHRNLEQEYGFIPPSGGPRQNTGSGKFQLWEFPLLLKYKLPVPQAHPFLEAGPSFRIRASSFPWDPSSYGATVGIGAEFRVKGFQIAPVIRYTRWAADGPFPLRPTNPDQVELLTSFSRATTSLRGSPFGHKVRLGVIGGIAPTRARALHSFTVPLPLAPPLTFSESIRYAAGLTLEVQATHALSFELDGIYRPLHFHDLYPTGSAPPYSVLTWEIPILGKYRLTSTRIAPFVEAGPSLRFSGNLNGTDPSHIGVTAGIGAETNWRFLRIAPAARYTRWAADDVRPFYRTKQDQLELLIGFSF